MGTHRSVSPGLIMENMESQIRGTIKCQTQSLFILALIILLNTSINIFMYHYFLSNQDSTNGHSQEPINCNDEGDVIGWESDRGQHDHHSDQTSLRDSGRPDTCSSRCDAGLLKRI